MAPHPQLPFFDLQTPLDLFRKMEADLAAFAESTCDSRLAFNFFVTAEHMSEWLELPVTMKKEHALLRVVSHLANGAKHYAPDPKRNTSVVAATFERYAVDDYFAPGYVEDWLLVHFSAEEAAELGADALDARELGRRVLEFWRLFVPGG